MIQSLLKFFFGSKNERDIKRLNPIVVKINELEKTVHEFDDLTLSSQTIKFKERIRNGESLDDLLPEVFATIREVSLRKLGMRHFDVQMMGGVALHEGRIAEMKTGEGKTLTSTLAIILNSLSGNGVHVVTVNDYLAKRDANWMKPIYDFLGISVGIIQHDMNHNDRKNAYLADITYGTNNEFGFDYLRDNMVGHLEHKVQRSHNYAIVDEVDSILIDEARTPLIISGPSEESTDKYLKIDKIMNRLAKIEDFELDEKSKNVLLTEKGVLKVEEILGVGNLYKPENVDLVHHVHQALKAHHMYHKDVDYVVQGGEVIIVDEFTGRLMTGRRYSDGLHQAIEAKERVPIARESQTLATITFQNYFRQYKKLSGMTGTADTEAVEFSKIYNLDVVVIPSNLQVKRIDYGDRVYRTEKEKFNAILQEIKNCYEKSQPVLVGTISIEKSEVLSNLLKINSIPHNVLNAKFHEKEAEIIANAGKPKAVTIATNMAGRGTDIVLGGARGFLDRMESIQANEEFVDTIKNLIIKKDYTQAIAFLPKLKNEFQKKFQEIIEDAKKWEESHNLVLEAGGLHILGTERHESRRIDNQLRGRSGRQGDPGSSRFYLALEDDLMRIFNADRISSIMQRLKMPEGQEIEAKMVSNAIARSQKRVEGHNFDIRKHLLEYDDVMNQQRIVIYNLRNDLLENKNIAEKVQTFIEDVIENFVVTHCESKNTNSWEVEPLKDWLHSVGIEFEFRLEDYKNNGNPQLELFQRVFSAGIQKYNNKKEKVGEEIWRMVERNIFMEILDHRWKEHLYTMDHLREGIWTVGYSEKNPLVEYKIQGFKAFEAMLENLKVEIVTFIFKVEITENSKAPEEKKEYKKIGQESLAGFGELLGTRNKNSDDLSQSNNPVLISASAGGGSSRKSSRRKKK